MNQIPGWLIDYMRTLQLMELGFDPQAKIWRQQGSIIGEGPTDPAYDNPGNYKPMELGFDPKTGLWRPIGSVPGETNEQRTKAGR